MQALAGAVVGFLFGMAFSSNLTDHCYEYHFDRTLHLSPSRSFRLVFVWRIGARTIIVLCTTLNGALFAHQYQIQRLK